jgi:hypothetical protein
MKVAHAFASKFRVFQRRSFLRIEKWNQHEVSEINGNKGIRACAKEIRREFDGM